MLEVPLERQPLVAPLSRDREQLAELDRGIAQPHRRPRGRAGGLLEETSRAAGATRRREAWSRLSRSSSATSIHPILSPPLASASSPEPNRRDTSCSRMWKGPSLPP